jgi:hypothetical protein
MSTDTDEGTFDGALDDPAFAGLLAELRELAERPAPPVGPELAAILAGDLPPAVAPLEAARARRRRTASAVVIGLVSTGVLAGGISAAAADELPAPVQRVVARVVNTITPFEIPDRGLREHPDRDPDEHSQPSDPAEPEDHAVLPRDVSPPVSPAPVTPSTTGTTSGTQDDEREDEESTEPSDEPSGEESREGSDDEDRERS